MAVSIARTSTKGRSLFSFQALASGSSGNSYLLRSAKVVLLFDAGLRLPTLRKYLLAEGVVPGDLSAVLISHEHRDHCVGARDLAIEHRTPVCANADVLRATGLEALGGARVLDVQTPILFGDVEVTCFPVQHDAVRPVGFLIRVAGRTIAIATDLGRPTEEVVNAVQLSDLVVLEANHDLEMLYGGRYPHHLRRRVAGPKGHLSNAQAAGILAEHAKGVGTEVWLAHLSKENNSPQLALKTVRGGLRGTRNAGMSVNVALRDRPSLRWTGTARPQQLSLFTTTEAG